MKTYPAYKESGIEWLGEIPEHWSNVALKRLVITKITDGPHETPSFLPDGVPFISAEAITEGRIDFNKKRGYISKELDDLYAKKCKPKKDDIFIVKSGSTTGKVAIVETEENFNIWSPLALVRSNRTLVNPKFLFLALQSFYFRRQIELFWSFGTQPNIGMGVIENLRIILPSVSEQCTIAAYLDHKTTQIDTLIADKRSLIELYQEERAALINQAVNRGLDPDVPMKESGIEWLGEIPAHWEVKRLKYVVNKVGSGVTPKGGAEVYQDEGIPILRSQNIYFDGIHLEDVAFISEEIDNSMRNSRVHVGDVLLNITGASIGRCYYVEKNLGRANVNQHVCIIRPQKKMQTKLLNYILASSIGQTQITLSQTGSGREGLNFEQLRKFFIPYPNVDEQADIVNFIDQKTTQIDTLISDTEKEIQLLEEYRTALISEVVTGKIDVRDKAPSTTQMK